MDVDAFLSIVYQLHADSLFRELCFYLVELLIRKNKVANTTATRRRYSYVANLHEASKDVFKSPRLTARGSFPT